MKWIIAIFIVLDVVYQIFGISTDVLWWKYYDIIHYGGIFVIGLIYAVERRSLLIGLLSAYFGFVLGNIIFQVGLSKAEYLSNIKLDYVSFCYLAMMLLFIFITIKLCLRKSKKIG
jgi:hypothetical protein